MKLRRYKKNNKKRFFAVIGIILLIIVSFLCYLNVHVNPIIITANESRIKSITVDALNNAVSQTLATLNAYSDLISITYDTSGKISLISANSFNVNKLNNDIVTHSQSNLRDIGSIGFGVPLGTFTGIAIFNGIGPNINIKMLPVGSVQSSFLSKFTSVGINQTHHEIYINLRADVSVLLPVSDKKVTTSVQILIAENIIVGEVPQVYFNNTILNNQLNLIP